MERDGAPIYWAGACLSSARRLSFTVCCGRRAHLCVHHWEVLSSQPLQLKADEALSGTCLCAKGQRRKAMQPQRRRLASVWVVAVVMCTAWSIGVISALDCTVRTTADSRESGTLRRCIEDVNSRKDARNTIRFNIPQADGDEGMFQIFCQSRQRREVSLCCRRLVLELIVS